MQIYTFQSWRRENNGKIKSNQYQRRQRERKEKYGASKTNTKLKSDVKYKCNLVVITLQINRPNAPKKIKYYQPRFLKIQFCTLKKRP